MQSREVAIKPGDTPMLDLLMRLGFIIFCTGVLSLVLSDAARTMAFHRPINWQQFVLEVLAVALSFLGLIVLRWV